MIQAHVYYKSVVFSATNNTTVERRLFALQPSTMCPDRFISTCVQYKTEKHTRVVCLFHTIISGQHESNRPRAQGINANGSILSFLILRAMMKSVVYRLDRCDMLYARFSPGFADRQCFSSFRGRRFSALFELFIPSFCDRKKSRVYDRAWS